MNSEKLAGAANEKNRAKIWSLVLWAVGIAHRMEQTPDGWQIKVAPEEEERARHEIFLFETENANWPPPDPAAAPDSLPRNRPPTVLFMGLFAIFHAITGPWQQGNIWFEQGAVAGERILFGHEWWRLLTALTLHTNEVHLLGNILIGGVLIHFLCRSLGAGLGWLLILLAGIGGNYLNILTQGPAHNSVGFSTAIFGAIGILTGRQCMHKQGLQTRELLLPAAAGLALLAFIGSSGPNTDLGAHFYGLLTGLVLGVITWFIPAEIIRKATGSRQIPLLLISLFLIAYTWHMAIRATP